MRILKNTWIISSIYTVTWKFEETVDSLHYRTSNGQSYGIRACTSGWHFCNFRFLCHLIGELFMGLLFFFHIICNSWCQRVLIIFFIFDLYHLQYLEEKYPSHSLLPQDLTRRAINYQVKRIQFAY